jgi:hypothetical protein
MQLHVVLGTENPNFLDEKIAWENYVCSNAILTAISPS